MAFALLIFLVIAIVHPLHAAKYNMTCDFVVVGGGPGGTFTGYQLAKKYGQDARVCLFERESFLGGRFLDELQPDGLRIPMGGLRFYEYGLSGTTQLYVDLANELNITRYADYLTDGEPTVKGHNYAAARGQAVNDEDFEVLAERYVGLTSNNLSVLYGRMVQVYNSTTGPQTTAKFSSLTAWVRSLFNDETSKFLADTDRYRSDFNDPNDVPSWMEGYLWDSQFDDSIRSYPEGGMSAFCRQMASAITQLNHDNFVVLSQPVLSVNTYTGPMEAVNYQVETPDFTVFAGTAIIAIPGFDYNPYNETGYGGLSGDVADNIRATKYFKTYLPDPVAIVAQQWPNRWWESSSSGFTSGQAFTRAGLGSYAHIFTNATQYEYNANLTRTVYNDDLVQVRMWQEINRTQGIAGVEAEAIRSIQLVYPNITIPKPIKTLYHYHPAGWSWLRTGSFNENVTVHTLSDWAVAPLQRDVSNCTLVLPTDAWGVRESGWAAGAWGVAVKWLKNCHGIDIPNAFNICNPYVDPPLNQTWCDCKPNTIIPPAGLEYRKTYCPSSTRPRTGAPLQKKYSPRN